MDASLRILVVDDMPAMRRILKAMLEGIGFRQIIEAEDGEAAWQLIHDAATHGTEPFSLVVADWNMPGMSGVDLLRSIRSFSPTRELPFFMVTAEGDQIHIADAVRAGATDYIVKPFNAADLGAKISSLFSSY
jgi:two-component system chemotaxis response regulator CheY